MMEKYHTGQIWIKRTLESNNHLNSVHIGGKLRQILWPGTIAIHLNFAASSIIRVWTYTKLPWSIIKLLYQVSNRVNLKLSSNKTCCKYIVSSTVIWGNQPANTIIPRFYPFTSSWRLWWIRTPTFYYYIFKVGSE